MIIHKMETESEQQRDGCESDTEQKNPAGRLRAGQKSRSQIPRSVPDYNKHTRYKA